MHKVMGVEDSKWREAATAQMINAKTHVGERVPAMSSHANEVQLDFSELLRFSTSIYYKTVPGCGDSVYADNSEMECFIRVAWDWLYNPDPIHIKWRLKNYKSLMPMLKTSPFDWLNYEDRAVFFKMV